MWNLWNPCKPVLAIEEYEVLRRLQHPHIVPWTWSGDRSPGMALEKSWESQL